MSAVGFGEAYPAERSGTGGRLIGDPIFAAAAVVFVAMTVPTLMSMVLDDRQHLGLDIWLKPLKFQVAVAIFCATMAVYARWLPEGTTARRWYRAYVASVVAAMGVEIVWITGAAALGTVSHFNTTPVGMAFYAAMGVLAVWFTTSTAVYGALIARNRRSGLDPALRVGLALGLILTFVLTVGFAGTMANHGSHFVGPATTDAGGLWPMGWSREVGDLRVAHFFGTHAMHAVPLAGLAFGRWLAPRAGFWRRGPSPRRGPGSAWPPSHRRWPASRSWRCRVELGAGWLARSGILQPVGDPESSVPDTKNAPSIPVARPWNGVSRFLELSISVSGAWDANGWIRMVRRRNPR